MAETTGRQRLFASALGIRFDDRTTAEALSEKIDREKQLRGRLSLMFVAAAGEATDDAIDEAAMQDGIELSDWFGGEARRVYGLFVETAADRELRELVDLIHRKGGAITPRGLQMSSRRYRNGGEAETALDKLAKAGVGQWNVTPTSRRPRREFTLSALSTSTLLAEPGEMPNNVDVDTIADLQSQATGEDDR